MKYSKKKNLDNSRQIRFRKQNKIRREFLRREKQKKIDMSLKNNNNWICIIIDKTVHSNILSWSSLTILSKPDIYLWKGNWYWICCYFVVVDINFWEMVTIHKTKLLLVEPNLKHLLLNILISSYMRKYIQRSDLST